MIIGEETAKPDDLLAIAHHDLCIVIDPIDGTWNFAMGLPLFGVMLAIIERGETVFALLYDPLMDDWLIAHKGEGTYYHQKDEPPQKIQTGPQKDNTLYGLVGVCQQSPNLKISPLPVERLMAMGCSYYEYRLLTQGAVDFYLSGPTLNPWDHAAGVLALKEAGGYAGLVDEKMPYNPTYQKGRLLACRHRQLWDDLHPYITESALQ